MVSAAIWQAWVPEFDDDRAISYNRRFCNESDWIGIYCCVKWIVVAWRVWRGKMIINELTCSALRVQERRTHRFAKGRPNFSLKSHDVGATSTSSQAEEEGERLCPLTFSEQLLNQEGSGGNHCSDIYNEPTYSPLILFLLLLLFLLFLLFGFLLPSTHPLSSGSLSKIEKGSLDICRNRAKTEIEGKLRKPITFFGCFCKLYPSSTCYFE